MVGHKARKARHELRRACGMVKRYQNMILLAAWYRPRMRDVAKALVLEIFGVGRNQSGAHHAQSRRGPKGNSGSERG
jgi:hypothetical protein